MIYLFFCQLKLIRYSFSKSDQAKVPKKPKCSTSPWRVLNSSHWVEINSFSICVLTRYFFDFKREFSVAVLNWILEATWPLNLLFNLENQIILSLKWWEVWLLTSFLLSSVDFVYILLRHEEILEHIFESFLF